MCKTSLSEVREKQLIGALLALPDRLADARMLDPLDITNHGLKTIFTTMIALSDEGRTPHMEAVASRMESDGTLETIGGWQTLMTLANETPDFMATDELVRNVGASANYRRIESSTQELARLATNQTVGPDELRAKLAEIEQHLDRAYRRDDIGIDAAEMIERYPTLRPVVIDGLLRHGETMNVIAASKVGKSWLSLGLAFSVVTGRKWLGKHWTTPGRVLIIDNELHPESAAGRIKTVADAMSIPRADFKGSIRYESLRGRLTDLVALKNRLSRMKPGAFDLIILDAWYRFQPDGTDENSNGDVTRLYNQLDALAGRIDAAFVCIHHASKGNQSGKSVTDVGSGAGAQSRATDAHLVIRPHEDEGAVVVDAAVRSFKPIQPFCMRWQFPLWEPADDLDPTRLDTGRLKRTKTTDEAQSQIEQSKADTKERTQLTAVLDAYQIYPAGETAKVIREAAGMSGKTFGPINSALLRNGTIVPTKIKKGHSEYDGFKLKEVGQPGQAGQNGALSHLSHVEGGRGGTTALSLESGVQSHLTPVADEVTNQSQSLSHLTEIDHATIDRLFPVGGKP